MRLNSRLQKVADHVRSGSCVVDVGTDHAFLPIHLVNSGISPHVIACDINDGPLGTARSNIALAGLSNQIELRLCDGLSGIDPDEVDDIVIAGMGGELIARIIGDAEWLLDGGKRLILQPMSSAEDLRELLCNRGFSIEKECAVEDSDKLYAVMQVCFTGEVPEKNPEYCYIGEMAGTGGRPEIKYMRRQAQRLRKRAAGLEMATVKSADAEYAEELAIRIEGEIQNLIKGMG